MLIYRSYFEENRAKPSKRRSTYKEADAKISELSRYALGVNHMFPDVRTIIDIDGHDAKVLSLYEIIC